MSARIWIIYFTVWAAGAAIADTPSSQIFLGDFTAASGYDSGEIILWKPEVEGLTRYQLSLPKSGVANALKYRDRAALFYMSDQSDLGIDVVHKERGHFHLSYSQYCFKAFQRNNFKN